MGESASFEDVLSGGHPNSLGRTVEVVGLVLADERRIEELFGCYKSPDAVVRLRTSSALKRVERERHHLLLPFLDRLIDEIGSLDQASAQWTLAQLFAALESDMTAAQKRRAGALMQRNLAFHRDWIVLNTTLQVLTAWAKTDGALREWLKPQAGRLLGDGRKSVAKGAAKALKALSRQR